MSSASGQAFPDRVVVNILGKLETNEKSKVAALAVVRYLVDSCDSSLTDRKSSLLSGLRTLVNDASNRVKKELAQVIISMGSHDYLGLEGGESMIEFLVRLCAIKKWEAEGLKNVDRRGLLECVCSYKNGDVDAKNWQPFDSV